MQLVARVHAWGDGRCQDVNLGEFETEKAAQEAALRFRRRFADSVDAMMLFHDAAQVEDCAASIGHR